MYAKEIYCMCTYVILAKHWRNRSSLFGLLIFVIVVFFRFMRRLFHDISFYIPFTMMPNVEYIYQLCLDIYKARELKDFVLEEDLYSKLIFIYRSSHTRIRITRLPQTRCYYNRQSLAEFSEINNPRRCYLSPRKHRC